MRVDDAHVLIEVGIGRCRPLCVKLRDLLGEIARLISSIEKRDLRKDQQDE
jgi:hypothetical protein